MAEVALSDRPPRVLAIHAHPDDVELQCAGVLCLLRDRGSSIAIATMTPGDKGTAELGADEIAAVRRGEAAEAAALLGAEYHCLEFRDLEVVFDNPSRQRVAELLRRVQPDIVLAPPPVDYMPDHEIASMLVRDACFNAAVPNYATGASEPAPLLRRVPHLYYVDPIEGLDSFGQQQPVGFRVDISAVFARKQAMLACHASQRDWLRRQHGIDEYLQAQERWARRRGGEMGVEFAEGFRQHLGHPFPQDDRLRAVLELA